MIPAGVAVERSIRWCHEAFDEENQSICERMGHILYPSTISLRHHSR